MSSIIRDSFSILGISVFSSDAVYVLAMSDQAAERDIPLCIVFKWNGSDWGHYVVDFKCVDIRCRRGCNTLYRNDQSYLLFAESGCGRSSQDSEI